MNILDKIIEYKAQRLQTLKGKCPLSELKAIYAEKKANNTLPIIYSMYESMAGTEPHTPSIIAEIKRKSPSKGDIRADLIPASIAKTYEKCGARGISVLTEDGFFGGSDADLMDAYAAVKTPILRKDFIIDEYQIYEARLMGASCILLISACLTTQKATYLANIATDLGLDILWEVHNEDEIQNILPIIQHSKCLLGVNNRNLKTFEVSLDISQELINKYRDNIPKALWVSESGIYSHHDITKLMSYGYKGFLIGESILRSDNIAEHLLSLKNGV